MEGNSLKRGKKLVYYFIITISFLIFSLIISKIFILNSNNSMKLVNEDIHTSNIYYDLEIDGIGLNNWTWAKDQGYCTGSGTENDPYLFYEHTFEYNNGNGHCIAIKNSRKYFRFENCYFENSKQGFAGLFLFNTTNGQFKQCEMIFNTIGLLVSHSNDTDFNFFELNSIWENKYGIILNNSSNITFDCDTNTQFVASLRVWNNNKSGIELKNSHYNYFRGELHANLNGQDGILLNNSNFNYIDGCHFLNNKKNGITLFSSLNNTIYNNEIQQNEQNGIHLSFSGYNSIIDNEDMDVNKMASIYLEASSYNYIARNSRKTYGSYIQDPSFGIFLLLSDYNQIMENEFCSHQIGLMMTLSSYNDIIGNEFCYNNVSGITLYGSLYNNIYKNIIDNNKIYGIDLSSSLYNTVYENYARRNIEAGIIIQSSIFNRIIKNTASNNKVGIHLKNSNYTTIINNYLPDNIHCIEEENSENNEFLNNVCMEQFDLTFVIFLGILGPSLAVNLVLLFLIFYKRTK